MSDTNTDGTTGIPVAPVSLKTMSEDDMRSLAGQFVDMFVDHSRLAKQVADLSAAFEQAKGDWSQQASDLHRQIDELRTALVTAQAERDQMRTERDSAQRDSEYWQNTANDKSLQVSERNGRIDALEAKVRELEAANLNANSRVTWLENENASHRSELDARADRIHQLESAAQEVRAALDRVTSAVSVAPFKAFG